MSQEDIRAFLRQADSKDFVPPNYSIRGVIAACLDEISRLQANNVSLDVIYDIMNKTVALHIKKNTFSLYVYRIRKQDVFSEDIAKAKVIFSEAQKNDIHEALRVTSAYDVRVTSTRKLVEDCADEIRRLRKKGVKASDIYDKLKSRFSLDISRTTFLQYVSRITGKKRRVKRIGEKPPSEDDGGFFVDTAFFESKNPGTDIYPKISSIVLFDEEKEKLQKVINEQLALINVNAITNELNYPFIRDFAYIDTVVARPNRDFAEEKFLCQRRFAYAYLATLEFLHRPQSTEIPRSRGDLENDDFIGDFIVRLLVPGIIVQTLIDKYDIVSVDELTRIFDVNRIEMTRSLQLHEIKTSF